MPLNWTLKQDLKKIVDAMDHCLIIEKNSLKAKTLEALLEENFKIIEVDFRPTAENFAKFFYEEMKEKANDMYEETKKKMEKKFGIKIDSTLEKILKEKTIELVNHKMDEDILEEIVGEIQDEFDKDEESKAQSNKEEIDHKELSDKRQ